MWPSGDTRSFVYAISPNDNIINFAKTCPTDLVAFMDKDKQFGGIQVLRLLYAENLVYKIYYMA